MTLRFLLDSNVLSEPIRPSPNPRVLERFKKHRQQMATAAPVWNELLFGWGRLPPSRRKNHLESYLVNIVAASLPILPYDQAAASRSSSSFYLAENGVMVVLWWDPEHEICPSRLKNT